MNKKELKVEKLDLDGNYAYQIFTDGTLSIYQFNMDGDYKEVEIPNFKGLYNFLHKEIIIKENK